MAQNKKPIFHKYLFLTMGLAGIVILIFSVLITNKRFEELDHDMNRFYRLIALSEIELDTLEKEVQQHEISLQEIEKEISLSTHDKKHTDNLSKQILVLNDELTSLAHDIEARKQMSTDLDQVRDRSMTRFQIVYWVNTLILVAGLLIAVIGFLALGLHLEIFPDRRKKQRED